MTTKIPSWIKVMVANAKMRAAKRGLQFDLTPEDVVEMYNDQKGMCYWFNVPMQWRDDVGPRNPMIPTIDRADNTRGYVRSNCILACWGANAAKGSCDLESWEEFLDFLRAGLTSTDACVDETNKGA
jgi:hypothetical protein